jgi:hypothetical protein
MPDGRTVPQWISYPLEIDHEVWALSERRAAGLIDAGYSFHMELLSDWRTVSLTVEAPDDSGDFAIQTIINGPGVPGAIVALIDDAASRAGIEV